MGGDVIFIGNTYTPPARTIAEESLLYPLGGGQDDGPQIQAALLEAAYQRAVRLAPGDWTVATVIDVPNGSVIRGGPGVRITSTIPETEGGLGSPEQTVFYAVPPAATATTTLASATTPGSDQITLTSAAGFTVGGELAIINGNHVAGYVIQGIAGNVVTLDREVLHAFPTSGTSVTDRQAPKDIRLEADGMVVTGTGDAVVEWSGAWRCAVRGLVVETPEGGPGFQFVIVNFDVGSRECELTDSYLDGGGYSDSCWHFESAENCRAERVRARGAVNQAVFLSSGYNNTIDGCTGEDSGTGCVLNAADGTNGTKGASLQGCAFTGNEIGLNILNASKPISVSGCDARHNTGTGFAVNAGTAPSSKISFSGCHSYSNGGAGYYVVAGVTDVSFDGCTADLCESYGFEGEGQWSGNGITSRDCRLGGVRVGAAGRASVVQAVLSCARDTSLAAWGGFTMASTDARALRIQDARVEMSGVGTKSGISSQAAGVTYAENLVTVGGTYGWVASGGTLIEGPRVDLSSASTPYLGGTVYQVSGAMTARELGAGTYSVAPFEGIAVNLTAGDVYLNIPAASASPSRGAWEVEVLCVGGDGTYAVAITPASGDIDGASGWSLAMLPGEIRRFRAYPGSSEWKAVTTGQGPQGSPGAPGAPGTNGLDGDGSTLVAETASPVVTTDATPTQLLTWAVPAGRSRWYHVIVTGDDQANTNSVGYTRRVLMRNTGGTTRVVALSATGETQEDAGYSTATVAISASGANGTITGTGLNATTINWHVKVREL